MATKALLQDSHQIGKECAVIFHRDIEKDTLSGNSTFVRDFLNSLWNKLYKAGIRPEAGLMLTAKTMNQIETAPDGEQVEEKRNLLSGKFDRAIPCPDDCHYYYYRDELCCGVDDSKTSLLGLPPAFMKGSVIREIAVTNPDLAHNPLHKPDPYFNIEITKNT